MTGKISEDADVAVTDSLKFGAALGGVNYGPLASSIATYIFAKTATLLAKTFNLASNTLTGTTAQFNAALSDNDFATLAGSETLSNKTITTAGPITSTNAIKSTGTSFGIGYGTGAGATATQITSKSTGLTLNRPTGQITMNASALTAATVVSFVLTNSAVDATDVFVLNHISGGTPGSYSLNARAAAGSATIDVRNNTAGSLSEAIVIQFALIKGVNS